MHVIAQISLQRKAATGTGSVTVCEGVECKELKNGLDICDDFFLPSKTTKGPWFFSRLAGASSWALQHSLDATLS